MMQQFQFPRDSSEAIELDCLTSFREMLHTLGLSTVLSWNSTEYTLVIKKGWWIFARIVQTLRREINPQKPWVFTWDPPKDCWTECALKSLFRSAFDRELEARGIVLKLSLEMAYAISVLPLNLVFGRHVFPVKYEVGESQPVVSVVSGAPLTDEHRQLASFIWPGATIIEVPEGEYPEIKRYLNLYIMRFCIHVRTPFLQFCAHSAEDSWDSPGGSIEE